MLVNIYCKEYFIGMLKENCQDEKLSEIHILNIKDCFLNKFFDCLAPAKRVIFALTDFCLVLKTS